MTHLKITGDSSFNWMTFAVIYHIIYTIYSYSVDPYTITKSILIWK